MNKIYTVKISKECPAGQPVLYPPTPLVINSNDCLDSIVPCFSPHIPEHYIDQRYWFKSRRSAVKWALMRIEYTFHGTVELYYRDFLYAKNEIIEYLDECNQLNVEEWKPISDLCQQIGICIEELEEKNLGDFSIIFSYLELANQV